MTRPGSRRHEHDPTFPSYIKMAWQFFHTYTWKHLRASRIVVLGAGLPSHNEMTDFTIKPGVTDRKEPSHRRPSHAPCKRLLIRRRR